MGKRGGLDVLPVKKILSGWLDLNMGRGKRKCRTCGNLFEPKGPGDRYCSHLCRTTGCFIGGGGDTTKPNTTTKRLAKKPDPMKRTRPSKRVDFPRVRQMMELPISERWEIAKDFTPEEQDFVRRLAKRELIEEKQIECITDWDCGEESQKIDSGMDQIGESDDGSV